MGAGRLIYYCAIPANLSSKLVALICIFCGDGCARRPAAVVVEARESERKACSFALWSCQRSGKTPQLQCLIGGMLSTVQSRGTVVDRR